MDLLGGDNVRSPAQLTEDGVGNALKSLPTMRIQESAYIPLELARNKLIAIYHDWLATISQQQTALEEVTNSYDELENKSKSMIIELRREGKIKSIDKLDLVKSVSKGDSAGGNAEVSRLNKTITILQMDLDKAKRMAEQNQNDHDNEYDNQLEMDAMIEEQKEEIEKLRSQLVHSQEELYEARRIAGISSRSSHAEQEHNGSDEDSDPESELEPINTPKSDRRSLERSESEERRIAEKVSEMPATGAALAKKDTIIADLRRQLEKYISDNDLSGSDRPDSREELRVDNPARSARNEDTEAALQQAKNTIDGKDAEIEKMRKEIVHMKLKIHTAAAPSVPVIDEEDENSELRDSLRTEIARLKNSLTQLSDSRQSIREELAKWREDFCEEYGREPNKQEKATVKPLLEQFKQVDTDLKAVRQELEGREGQLNELPPPSQAVDDSGWRAREAGLLMEIESLKERANTESTAGSLEEVSSKLQTVTNDYNAMKEAIASMADEQATLMERIELLKEENSDLRGDNEEENGSKDKSPDQKVIALKNERSNLRRESNSLRTLNEKQLREMKLLEDELQNLHNALAERDNLLEQYSSRVAELEGKDDTSTVITEVTEDVGALKDKIKKSKTTEGELETAIRELDSTIANLEKEKKEIVGEKESLEKEKENLLAYKEQAEKEKEKLNQEKEELEKQHEGLATQFKELELSKNALENQLGEGKSSQDKIYKDYEASRQELQSIQNELKSVSEELGQTKEQLAVLGEEKKEVDESLAKTSTELEASNEKLATALKEGEQYKSEVERLKKELEHGKGAQTDVQKTLASANEELRATKTELESVNTELTACKATIETLEANIARSKDEHSDGMSQIQGELSKFKAENKDLTTELEDTKSKLSSTENDLKTARGKMSDLENTVSQSSDSVASLESKIEAQTQLIGNLKNYNAESEERNKELIENLNKEKKAAEGDVSRLSEELLGTQKEIAVAEKAAEKSAKEISRLSNLVEDSAKWAKKADQLEKEKAGLMAAQNALSVSLRDEASRRKKYYNIIEDMKGKIRVYCRVRPISKGELAAGHSDVIEIVDEFSIVVQAGDGHRDEKREYLYDAVFGPKTSQAQVFSDSENLIQSAFDGYNVCIFAYGQTGSGKTYTIHGEDSNLGLTPRAIEQLFDIVAENSTEYNTEVGCYMLELYNEKLMDMLKPHGEVRGKLSTKLDSTGIVFVENIVEKKASDAKELLAIMNDGLLNRHTAETNMNVDSSRSHLVFSVTIKTKNKKTGEVAIGKLSLIDLAGSERVGKSGAEGQTLKEAISINKSLSALGNVIKSLTDEQSLIPYRESPLTLLLMDSLGGNAKTLMFVNISPASYNRGETINSLEFAKRAKTVTNVANKNVETKQVKQMRQLIYDLKAELREIKGVTGEEEEELTAGGYPVPKHPMPIQVSIVKEQSRGRSRSRDPAPRSRSRSRGRS